MQVATARPDGCPLLSLLFHHAKMPCTQLGHLGKPPPPARWQSFAKLLVRTHSQQLMSPGVVRVAQGGSEGFVLPAYFLVLPLQPGLT